MNSKNTRKALIGTFIGMMALTAASAATAGVAWFTTTRTATVQLPNAQIVSNRGELRVGAFGTDPSATNYYKVADAQLKMDALSSADGENFYNALLDVDGSELGKYKKDSNPTVATVGFSAGTQANSDTILGVYLDALEIKVTDDYGKQEFTATASQVDFVLTEQNAIASISGVKVNDRVLLSSEYEYAEQTKTISLIGVSVAADDKVLVSYHLEQASEVEATDPVLNSVRVALFAGRAGQGDDADDLALAENSVLVWDTKHSNEENHRGVKAGEKDVLAFEEEHTILGKQKFVDLDHLPNSILGVKSTGTHSDNKEVFTLDAAAISAGRIELANLPENVDDIIEITPALTDVKVNGVSKISEFEFDANNDVVVKDGSQLVLAEGNYVDVYYDYDEEVTYAESENSGYTYSLSADRVTLANANLGNGDIVKVSYRYDEYEVVEHLANSTSAADLYYAGEDLDNNADKDISEYGVYLGTTESRLDIVVRAWIEGTDADHSLKGDEYGPNTEKNSIDVTGHNYEVSMLASLEAIDADVA